MASRFLKIEGNSKAYYGLLALLGLTTLIGVLAAHYMETHGHVVTGMTNQIVWGMPHVFAVFLIVAASGALNVASIGSVFGRPEYKPFGRVSGLLAIALLVGGLAVLVLDLGRPDRLIVAMTVYNFKSIFAWNIFLYIGFILIIVVYLWMMFEPKLNRYSRFAGTFAFGWRFVLTTGTGSIFGFLVSRQAYDAAIMAPMFILMSLSLGTAVFILMISATGQWTGRPLSDQLMNKLKRLLGIFVMAVLYFVMVYNLTNLYATEHHGVERFILMDGGIYTALFWVVQVLMGSLAPLALFYLPAFNTRFWTLAGAVLVILGGLAQVYVIIIGGQAFPMPIFPGMEAGSSFYDGIRLSYAPSLPEFLLGIGGISLALLITAVAIKVLPFLPERLCESESTGS